MNTLKGFYFAPLAFALLITPSWAGITTFLDRATWEAAVGPLDFDEDFEGFSQDIDFNSVPTSAPDGFSLSHSGPSFFRNLIDVTPLGFPDGNGTNGVSTFVDGDAGDTVTITPDQALVAFALDVSTAADGELATITTLGPGGTNLLTIPLTNGIDAFFGFQATAGDTIVSVLLLGQGDPSTGEGFFMDNIAGVFVPEPSSLTLAAAGLLAASVYCLRRRRK